LILWSHTGRNIAKVPVPVGILFLLREGAKGNFKGGFGYHPLGAWVDNTNEALAAVLRPGNAGSNTAADHLTVVDWALSQLPDRWRGKPILIRADGAGYSHPLITELSRQGLEFSVGYPVTDAVRTAIAAVPAWAWQVACNADGDLREHADVIEITSLLDLSRWTGSCPDMRVIVRRELPHPGATLDAFEIRDGYRYQAFTTNTLRGQLAFLEARHRAHARVEDRIRTGKDTGLGHLPSRHENINAVWVELALIAADLLALASPVDAAHRRARAAPRRTQDPALPAAARRGPDHPRTAQSVPAPGRALAVGAGSGPSLPAPAASPSPGLTASTTDAPRPTRITETPDASAGTQRCPRPPRPQQDHPASSRPSTGASVGHPRSPALGQPARPLSSTGFCPVSSGDHPRRPPVAEFATVHCARAQPSSSTRAPSRW